jgi:hypothetical protein
MIGMLSTSTLPGKSAVPGWGRGERFAESTNKTKQGKS